MNATIGQFVALNITITRALLTVIERLPDIEETIRLAEEDDNGKKLADSLLSTLLSLTEKQETQPEAQPVPEASVLTVEVVAEFPLGGQKFDAVRIKWMGETAPKREEAIRAADTDGSVVRTNEQWSHVYKHRRELPETLNTYWLITARPSPGSPRGVSCLYRGSRGWCEGSRSLSLGRLLGDCGLVLRRRT